MKNLIIALYSVERIDLIKKILGAAPRKYNEYKGSFKLKVYQDGDVPDLTPKELLKLDNKDGKELGFIFDDITEKLIKTVKNIKIYDASFTMKTDYKLGFSPTDVLKKDIETGADLGFDISNIKQQIKKVKETTERDLKLSDAKFIFKLERKFIKSKKEYEFTLRGPNLKLKAKYLEDLVDEVEKLAKKYKIKREGVTALVVKRDGKTISVALFPTLKNAVKGLSTHLHVLTL